MRAAILLAVCLLMGGVALGAVPAASACTSDPAILCGVINAVGECGAATKYTDPMNTVKSCLP